MALLPSGLLLCGSALLFVRRKTVWSLVQLAGAGCLLLMVITHVLEVLDIFAFMKWGAEHSAGHYLDLTSAILGLTLFPVGYLLDVLARRRA